MSDSLVAAHWKQRSPSTFGDDLNGVMPAAQAADSFVAAAAAVGTSAPLVVPRTSVDYLSAALTAASPVQSCPVPRSTHSC